MADQLCRRCGRPRTDGIHPVRRLGVGQHYFDPAPPEAKRSGCSCVKLSPIGTYVNADPNCPEHGSKRGKPCVCDSLGPDHCDARHGPPKPEPEAGQELPPLRDWGDSFDVLEHSRIYRTAGGVLRRRAIQDDLLALIPKLTPEQRRAFRAKLMEFVPSDYAMDLAQLAEERDAAREERDIANARAASLQHDVDELGDEVAGCKRALDENAELRAQLSAAAASIKALLGRCQRAEKDAALANKERDHRWAMAKEAKAELARLRPVVEAAREAEKLYDPMFGIDAPVGRDFAEWLEKRLRPALRALDSSAPVEGKANPLAEHLGKMREEEAEAYQRENDELRAKLAEAETRYTQSEALSWKRHERIHELRAEAATVAERQREACDECSHFTMTPNTSGPPVRITCRICAATNSKLASAEARVRELEEKLRNAQRSYNVADAEWSKELERGDRLQNELAALRGREKARNESIAADLGLSLGQSAPAQSSRCTWLMREDCTTPNCPEHGSKGAK